MILPPVRSTMVILAAVATLGCKSSSSSDDTQSTGSDDTDNSAEGSDGFSCANGCDGTQEVSPGDCCDDSCYYCTYRGATLGNSRNCVDHVCADAPCSSITPVQAGEPCWDPEFDSEAPSEELTCTTCADGLTCREGRCE